MLKKFQEQLEKLKTLLSKMGSAVEEQLNLSIRAILEEDEEKANTVFELEKYVDKVDLKIEKNCQKLFALNQPVAMDLRLIISAINLSTDLERIGDLSVNISQLFLITKKKPTFIDEIKFKEMSQYAYKMYKDALDSFINNDVEKARKVIMDDKKLDELNSLNDAILIQVMRNNPDSISDAVHYLDICHQLERIGDHATNIAENVYFVAEADIIKHNYEKYIFNDEEYDIEENETDSDDD